MIRYQPPVNKKPVMKAKHLHQIPEKKKIWPAAGELKKDGVYAYQIMRADDYRIFSRTGMEYTSLNHLNVSGWLLHVNQEDVVLIFEVHHDTYPVNIISGYCRDKKTQHPELYAVVHDIIPYDDFVAGACDIPYADRRDALVEYLQHAYESKYKLSHSFMIRDEEHAQEIFALASAQGEEGIIGRPYYGLWLGGHRKNENYWKMKIELSYDLEVIGMEEGKGKYKGTLGKLLCRFRKFGKKNGELCVVKCSGMTDAQRDQWWLENQTGTVLDISGTIVKVDAMTFSKNGLLREPRFKEVREDKLEADL